MALLPCRECGREISSEASVCPGCGAQILPKFETIASTKKLPFVVFLTIVCFPIAILWIWISRIYLKNGDYASNVGPLRKLRYSITILSIWLLFALLFEFASSGSHNAYLVRALPSCDDKSTIALLKSAIADSPANKILNTKILDVTNVAEISWSEEGQLRVCHAHAFTNGGEQDISFSLKWIDRSTGKYWLSTNPNDGSGE